MPMSGVSADRAGRPSKLASVASAVTADGAPRTSRRATTRVVPELSRSPQTAMPMPSEEAPTAGCSASPVPASRAGSPSSGVV